jgi:hypothetical protein
MQPVHFQQCVHESPQADPQQPVTRSTTRNARVMFQCSTYALLQPIDSRSENFGKSCWIALAHDSIYTLSDMLCFWF